METATRTAPAQFPNIRGWFKREENSQSFELSYDDEQLENGTEYQLLILKRDKEYIKKLVECSLSLQSLAFQDALSKSVKEYGSEITPDGVNVNFVHMLNSLGRFTGYLVNCSSWRDQEIHQYDKDELRNRLEKLLMHLK